MQPKAAPRTQEERTADAKARLREAALYLFANDGYERTTLAAISLRAGFSRTLAQYHYADRGALALEILEDHIVRDNHIALIECSDDASAEEAWALLQGHLDALKRHYGSLHGTSERDAETTGAMAIHAAALTSTDTALSQRVEQLSREQVARIERILRLCQDQGMIAQSVDIRATSVLYVHAVWGLAQALFASPNARPILMGAFEQFGALLNSLKRDEGQ